MHPINSRVLWKQKSMTIVTIGINLVKNVFAVHRVDGSGKPALVGYPLGMAL